MSRVTIHRLRFAEVGIATLLFSGCLRHAADPVPPDAPVHQTAHTVVIDYAHRLGQSFDEAAGQLQAGTLTTAAETNALLQASNAEARKHAFEPLDKWLNDELGGDHWDPKHAERCFEQIAHALRSFR